EALARDRRAVERLREAMSLSEEPAVRARIACELFGLLVYSGEWDVALALIDSALRDVGDHDRDGTIRLETMRAAMTAYDPRLVDRFDRDRPRLQTLAIGGEPAARPLSLLLAVVSAWRVDGIDQAVGLVE